MSIIVTPYNNDRIFHRGGNSAGTDFMTTWRATANCTSLCASIMAVSGLCWNIVPNTGGCDPYYAKCYETLSTLPLNGIRVAFASQYGTTNMDPGLPQITPITNISACLGLYFFIHCDLFLGKVSTPNINSETERGRARTSEIEI